MAKEEKIKITTLYERLSRDDEQVGKSNSAQNQDEILLEEVIHQMEEWDKPEQTSHQPSGEVIHLTNAINRGLGHPDDPQEVISLILQGAVARYACCPNTQEHTNRPLDMCWDRIRLAVSHINISEENTVKVTS